jgi:hypothetical protein
MFRTKAVEKNETYFMLITLLPYILRSSRYTNKSDTMCTFPVSVHLGLLVLIQYPPPLFGAWIMRSIFFIHNILLYCRILLTFYRNNTYTNKNTLEFINVFSFTYFLLESFSWNSSKYTKSTHQPFTAGI